MAVMVTMTLPIDEQAYRAMHGQLLPLAISQGILFHSAHEVGGQVKVVDFWPSADAWTSFSEGPMAAGMKAAGMTPPGDVEITEVLSADAG